MRSCVKGLGSQRAPAAHPGIGSSPIVGSVLVIFRNWHRAPKTKGLPRLTTVIYSTAAESFAAAIMSSSHKPPEQDGLPDPRGQDPRDAAVLTPPPRGHSSPGSDRTSDAPTLVDITAETLVPMSASDAPTLIDAEPRRPASPPPPDLHSSQPMLPPGT